MFCIKEKCWGGFRGIGGVKKWTIEGGIGGVKNCWGEVKVEVLSDEVWSQDVVAGRFTRFPLQFSAAE